MPGLGLEGGDAGARRRVASTGLLLSPQGDDVGAELGQLGRVLRRPLLALAFGLLLAIHRIGGDEDGCQRHHGEEDPAAGDGGHADAGDQREQGAPPVGAGARAVDVGGSWRFDLRRQRGLGGAELAGEHALRRAAAEHGELALADVDDREHRTSGVDVVAGGQRRRLVDGDALDHRPVRRAGVVQRRALRAALDGEVDRGHERVVQRHVGTGATERQLVPVVQLHVQPAVGSGHGDDEAARRRWRVFEHLATAADAIAVLEVDLAEQFVGAERASGQRERLAGEAGVGQGLLEVTDAGGRLGVDERVVQPVVGADDLQPPRGHGTISSRTTSPAVTTRSPAASSIGTDRRAPSRSTHVP